VDATGIAEAVKDQGRVARYHSFTECFAIYLLNKFGLRVCFIEQMYKKNPIFEVVKTKNA
jgi:hypothetical protein